MCLMAAVYLVMIIVIINNFTLIMATVMFVMKCCIKVSEKCVMIVSGKGLSLVRCQAITWISVDLEIQKSLFKNIYWKCCLHDGRHFVEASVFTGSGNGLLPDSTKPLPEPVLTYIIISKIQWHSSDAILEEIYEPLITKLCLKIVYQIFD